MLQENIGIFKNLNNAITGLSGGEYIVFLASDDLYRPSKIEGQVRMLEVSPNADLCYTQGIEFDDASGSELRTFPSRLVTGNVLSSIFLHKSYAAGSVRVARRLFDEIGGFDESLKFEDWDFAIRAAAETHFAAVKKTFIFLSLSRV